MPTIQIKIKLENADYCNGCNALVEAWNWCSLFKLNMKQRRNIYNEEEFIRPDICKQQNKEIKE